MPAAVPALVMTASSSTYSTAGSTLAAGYMRASLAAWRQCVVQPRSSSSPAAPRMKAPVHTLSTVQPRAAARCRAASSGCGQSPVMQRSSPGAGTAIRSAVSSRSRPNGVSRLKPAVRPQRPRLAGDDREVVAGQSLVGAVGAEHLAQHAELKRPEAVEDDDRHVRQHADHHPTELAGSFTRVSFLPLSVRGQAGQTCGYEQGSGHRARQDRVPALLSAPSSARSPRSWPNARMRSAG